MVNPDQQPGGESSSTQDDDEEAFLSAWLKLGWAYRHGESLQHEIAAHASSDPSFVEEVTFDRQQSRLVVSVASISPIPARLGLILGDMVNCQRSCLDRIAWAAVQRGTQVSSLTEKQLTFVYFPLNDTAEKFDSAGNQKIPGVEATDLALIKEFQRYGQPDGAAFRQFTAALVRLVKDDKHRQIQPVWAVPDDITIGFTLRDCEVAGPINFAARGQPLDVGKEVYTLDVRATGPNPDAEVQGEVTTRMCLPDGIWLEDFMAEINGALVALLSQLCGPPAELFELGVTGLGRAD